MVVKNIMIGGYTVNQRKKVLEKTKAKYEKKGYKFLNFEENGTLKSVASFEVDEAILRKEKSIQLITLGVGIMIISAIAYFS